MPLSDWLRPPRQLVTMLLATALVLLVALGWLGWRLVDQDRVLRQQRAQDRLEAVADRVVAGLERQLAAAVDSLASFAGLPDREREQRAAAYGATLGPDGLVVALLPDRAVAHPASRLLYHPSVPATDEADPDLFTRGEWLEYRQRDFDGAASTYRAIARVSAPAVRAAALLRLGRVLRKTGRLEEALEVYAELATAESSSIAGLPAELVARAERLQVLDELSRFGQLRHEGESLHVDLHRGRWRVTRATYEFYVRETERRLLPAGPGKPAVLEIAPAVSLAEAVAWLWHAVDTPDGQTGAGAGRRTLWTGTHPVLVLWTGSTGRAMGLVAGRAFIEAVWLGALDSLLAQDAVRVALLDPEGRVVTSPFDGSTAMRATRAAAETRLPWTVQVASVDATAALAAFGTRRRLELMGLTVVGLLAVIGVYGVARGVTRELEVARLQSDFVAAVSHEFRSPLTSLRQLTELLVTGRLISEARRTEYYTVIHRESDRLHRLVEDLLDFGRMEAGALEFRVETLNAATLTRDVVGEFCAERPEADADVTVADGCDAYTLRGDREALHRALWNLLDNAVKYAPDDRTIRVEVAGSNGRVRIAVHDRGPGIPPGEQRRIFQKFVRGSRARGSAIRGTGIGLAMVQHIVTAHQGHVGVSSREGAGSTFTIELPLVGADE